MNGNHEPNVMFRDLLEPGDAGYIETGWRPERRQIPGLQMLERECLHFAVSSGYYRYQVSMSIPLVRGSTSIIPQWHYSDLHNGPSGWVQEMSETCIADPVTHLMRRSSVPTMAWDRSLYEAHGAIARWEAQAKYGFGCGLTARVPLEEGTLILFSVARDTELPESRELTYQLEEIACFAQCIAKLASLRLSPGGHAAGGDMFASLTPLERQCVHWISKKYARADISSVLGISDSEVLSIFATLQEKLNCATPALAADKAIRIGLVSAAQRANSPSTDSLTTIPWDRFMLAGSEASDPLESPEGLGHVMNSNS